jgi:uncharacterized damage-inducible protein DinB
MADLTTHLQTMAAYNAWANHRLYAAATSLPDAAYRRSAGAYFGSLHGTLNHLLATDRIWLRRLTGVGEAASRLDAILFESLDALRAARETEDSRLERYVAELSAAELDGMFEYATTSGRLQRQPRWEALVHLFNHQTHHRGQAHAILTRLGITEPPSLDLIVMQRERAAAHAA